MGHERRFEPAIDELRQLVKIGSFGTIMHVGASFSHDKLRGLASDNRRIDAPGEPPLAMTATGIHLTDLFIDLAGPVESFAAFAANRVAFASSADVLSLQLRFARRATGYINTILATPFYARLIIYGSEAWAEVLNTTHPDQAGLATLTISATYWLGKHIDIGMEQRGLRQPVTVRAVNRRPRALSFHR